MTEPDQALLSHLDPTLQALIFEAQGAADKSAAAFGAFALTESAVMVAGCYPRTSVERTTTIAVPFDLMSTSYINPALQAVYEVERQVLPFDLRQTPKLHEIARPTPVDSTADTPGPA
ncbi:MAG: hypothetical protein DI552_00655 [Brevundimonas sp.]|uniref:hypothetical protein n=1 Tax=Brevundimonas sp. TaxID=1871086 RepID=UPI000DBBC779|nr:hypothetical protein [Brevundimonas sp.]PZU62243.1 MAG: hypothetical protein DI552_00655 [Brevundimonas sp.]